MPNPQSIRMDDVSEDLIAGLPEVEVPGAPMLAPITPLGPSEEMDAMEGADGMTFMERPPAMEGSEEDVNLGLDRIEAFTFRITGIQQALDEALNDAESLRKELQSKAAMLRKLAGALESF